MAIYLALTAFLRLETDTWEEAKADMEQVRECVVFHTRLPVPDQSWFLCGVGGEGIGSGVRRDSVPRACVVGGSRIRMEHPVLTVS